MRIFFGLMVLLFSATAFAQKVDWSLYEKLLTDHVSQGVINGTSLAVVDYEAVKRDEAYSELVAQLAKFDVNQLATKEEKLAFYINAYNVFAIKMVLDHWPVESIRDIGSFFSPVWKKTVGTLAGKAVTLDEIEHKIIRPMGEPRIHFAIVCASVSCPDLLNEPFHAERLNEQLDRQTKAFLANDVKGLRVKGDEIQVSKIFDWFEEDFDKSGGIASFVRSYRPELPKGYDVEAELDYDWSLNRR